MGLACRRMHNFNYFIYMPTVLKHFNGHQLMGDSAIEISLLPPIMRLAGVVYSKLVQCMSIVRARESNIVWS